MRNFTLRPSAAAAWVRCAGSVRLSQPFLYEGGDNTVRDYGTAGHWVAYEQSRGVTVNVGTLAPNGVICDLDMQRHAATYLATTQTWGIPVHYELPVHCRGIHEECGGTLDAGGYNPATNTIHVGDYKLGFRVVPVQRNWQLVCYLEGLANHFGLNLLECNFSATIVQPRVWTPQGVVHNWHGHGSQLLPMLNELKAAALRVMSGDVMCVWNKEGCRNCKARHRCPTSRFAALGELHDSHEAIPHDLPFAEAEAELNRLQESIAVMQAYATGLEQQVTHAMQGGAQSRYFAMDTGTTALQWDAGVAHKIKAAAMLLGKEVTKEPELITPTQALKVLPPGFVQMHARRHQKAPKLTPIAESKIIKLFENK